MTFNKHFNLEGQHALLSASKYHWLNDNDEEFYKRTVSFYAATIGTILHDVAKKRIKHGFKIKKGEKTSVILELVDKGIPLKIIEMIDFDSMFDNLMVYINDCVSFKMRPEVLLYYSDNCFGTADAIRYDERDPFLRIHDLKTGVNQVKMEQLMIYASLFCLEYRKSPEDTKIELRIYQNNEVIVHSPPCEQIKSIMKTIIDRDKVVNAIRGLEV